jgi:dihydroflavonol-4-reductase
MAKKLTVVTGPTGQVGLHLVDELLAQGHRVRALVLEGDEGLGDRDVERVVGDVRDPDCLRRTFEGADVVHHLAAVVSTAKTPSAKLWSVNVDGARNAARQARLAGVRRFVHFSSIVVFEQSQRDRPLDESTPRVGGTGCAPYSRSKVLGERAVRHEASRGLDAVVVHPTVVVGPYETHHQGIVSNLIAKQQFGKLPALLDGGFNVVDALDVVAGAMAAAERGRTGESYILGGHWHSVHEFARIAQTVGIGAAPRIRLPLWMARAALPAATLGARLLRKQPLFNAEELRQLDGNPDIRSDKAARELGYEPRPIDDSLRRCHAWLAQEQAEA